MEGCMVVSAGGPLTPAEILELVPPRPPFRFLDEIVEIDGEHAIGRYTFRHDEHFYAGHFPQHPVTPGVILIEAMAQLGVVALGIYLAALERPLPEVRRFLTVFTDAQVEFHELVRPGDRVTMGARKVFWRRMKLRSEVELRLADGRVAASGTVAGMGVVNAAQ